MGLFLFVVFGFAIGFLAHSIVPGSRKLGLAMTMWLGIAGSLLGSLLMSFLTLQRATEMHAAGVIGSLIGAVLVLASGGVFRRPAPAQHGCASVPFAALGKRSLGDS
jgi:uncharacterized membrane protein YeaQ/YmgE (transglycosylase-associated protein family)